MISFRAWADRNKWFLNIDGFQGKINQKKTLVKPLTHKLLVITFFKDVTCWTPGKVRGESLLKLNDTQTRDEKTGRLCSFPAVLDVLLFNRMQRLVVQTSAVGFPIPSIKWYGQHEETQEYTFHT